VRRETRLLIAASACALPLLAMAAGTARADTVNAISQLSGFHQMVVDTSVSPGYIFMAGSDSIVVTDLSGNNPTTLETGNGVEGIALSSDGRTLYAALTAGTDADSIAAITVSATPTQITTYPLAPGDVPVGLTVQSGKIWVSYNDGGQTDPGAIGDIDPTTATGNFETQSALGSWSSPPDLAADPSDKGVLAAVQPGVSPAVAETFSTTSDPATPIAAQGDLGASENQCSFEDQLAVMPGGTDFIAACQSPLSEYVYSAADLSPDVSVSPNPYGSGSSTPGGVAVDASGLVAVGTFGSPSAIYVYGSDGTLLNIFTVTGPQSLVDSNGLAWEDTTAGPQLAALVAQGTGSATSYSLEVFDQPTVTRSVLTLNGPSSAPAGRSMTLTGTLAFSTGSDSSGIPLTITRTVSGSTASKSFPVSTGPGGAFSVADIPTSTGTYTYTVNFPGNSTTAAATASLQVSVSRAPTSLTLTTGSTTVTYEPTIQVVAQLGPTFKNRKVSIYAQPIGSKGKKLLKSGTVNSSGELSATYKAARSTTFSAVFSGDPEDTPKTVSRSVFVRARVSDSISGYYASKHIGGLLYRLFHSTAVLHAAGSVAPNKHGECLQFEVQEFFQGSWKANVKSPCISLSTSSQAFQAFGLNQADIGFHYRIRANYIRSSSDKANLSAPGAWRYLIVEK
jgi:hypothetical protein